MTIYTALNDVMRDVQGVGKHDRNTAPNGNYNFRGVDAVTNAVGPALREHGVIVVPELLTSEYGTINVGKQQTQMGHARITVAFTWYGPEGDSIRSVTAGEAFDVGDKATAKAHSVAFRTAMIQTLCLPTDEPDPDASTYARSGSEMPPAERTPAPPPSEADKARAELLAWAAGQEPPVAARDLNAKHIAEHGRGLGDEEDPALIRAYMEAAA